MRFTLLVVALLSAVALAAPAPLPLDSSVQTILLDSPTAPDIDATHINLAQRVSSVIATFKRSVRSNTAGATKSKSLKKKGYYIDFAAQLSRTSSRHLIGAFPIEKVGRYLQKSFVVPKKNRRSSCSKPSFRPTWTERASNRRCRCGRTVGVSSGTECDGFRPSSWTLGSPLRPILRPRRWTVCASDCSTRQCWTVARAIATSRRQTRSLLPRFPEGCSLGEPRRLCPLSRW